MLWMFFGAVDSCGEILRAVSSRFSSNVNISVADFSIHSREPLSASDLVFSSTTLSVVLLRNFKPKASRIVKQTSDVFFEGRFFSDLRFHFSQPFFFILITDHSLQIKPKRVGIKNTYPP